MKKFFYLPINLMSSLFVMITLSGSRGISPFFRVVFSILIIHMHLPFLYAQEEVKIGQRVKVNVTLGPVISGVSNRIKSEMNISQKYTYSTGGLFGSSRTKNYSVRPWVQLGAELSLKENWSVKGALSNWGGTYRAYNSDLQVSPSVNTITGLLVWNPGNHALRLAAGPAFHLITQKAGDLSGRATKNSGKAGFVLEGGWRFPAQSLVFAEFQIQYQHVGMVGLGPYFFHRHYIGSDPYTETKSFTNINMNILVIGFGLGLRL